MRNIEARAVDLRSMANHVACLVLASIIVLATLFNGSIRTPAMLLVILSLTTLVAIISVLSLVCVGESTNNKSNFRWLDAKQKWLAFALVLWLCYQVVQIIPLPKWMLSWLSPTAFDYWAALPTISNSSGRYSISLDPHASQLKFLMNTSLVLVFFLVRHVVHKLWHAWCLLGAIVAAGIIQLILMVLPDVGQTLACWWAIDTQCSSSVSGSFINRNHHGGVLALALSALCGLLIFAVPDTARVNWRQTLRGVLDGVLSSQLLAWVLAVLLFIAIYASTSRSAVLAVFVAFAGCFLLLGRRSTAPSRYALCVFGSMVFIVIIATQSTWLSERFSWGVLMADERVEIWRLIINMIRDFPLVGSGAGTFEQVFPAYRIGSLRPLGYDHAHNDYLQMFSEQGLIGGMLIMGIGALFVREILKRWQRCSTDDPGLANLRVLLSVTALCATFTIQAGVEFVNHIPSSLLVFVVALGLIGCENLQNRSAGQVTGYIGRHRGQ